MKSAAFIGDGTHLLRVYAPALREEIGRMVRCDGADIHGPDWALRADDLSQVELLFATWGMPKLDAAFLAAAPKLEAVFYAAGSVKHFATPEAEERGIVICSAAEANGIPVAEYSVSVILLSLKGFWSYLRQPPADKFRRDRAVVRGAYGSKVGLVSLGSIGRRVAKMLRGYDLSILAYDPRPDEAAAAAAGISLVGLADLFATSDVVSLHAPWLPATEKMVGRELLGSMKQGATLINTARGAVVDEEALCEVLRERSDLTAVLDVTYPEPPAPDSPLRHLPNVILTPHIAGSTGPEVERMGGWMAGEAQRYLAGEPLRHKVEYDNLPLSA